MNTVSDIWEIMILWKKFYETKNDYASITILYEYERFMGKIISQNQEIDLQENRII